MSTLPDGGPAFPQTRDCVSWGKGATLRDYFAAKAMQALISRPGLSPKPFDPYEPESDDWRTNGNGTATAAYHYADAMLKARAKA